MATTGNAHLPASHPPGPAGYPDEYGTGGGSNLKAGGRRGGKVTNLIASLLLAVAVALSAAPIAGYKSGWAYYRRSNFVAPARLRFPLAVTLKIWVGWVKGSNSVTNILHRLAPASVSEYTYLHEVKESGQVIAGLAAAFLLLGGLVAFCCFLASLLYTFKRGGRTSPPGMGIALLIFGFLNMAWSIACYTVISVGTAIYTRRTLGATYIAWPDWCFFLAFFSGVFMWIAAALALADSRRSKRTLTSVPDDTKMTHNMTYEQPHGTEYEPKSAAV